MKISLPLLRSKSYHSIIMFSLSLASVVRLALLPLPLPLLAFLGGLSFFSGLPVPSFSVKLLSALRVRFFALVEPPLPAGDDIVIVDVATCMVVGVGGGATTGAGGTVGEGISSTVDKKSRATLNAISDMFLERCTGIGSSLFIDMTYALLVTKSLLCVPSQLRPDVRCGEWSHRHLQ